MLPRRRSRCGEANDILPRWQAGPADPLRHASKHQDTLDDNSVSARTNMTQPALRLPKLVEADPRVAQLLLDLSSSSELLWPGGELRVPVVPMGDALAATLTSSHRAGQLVRGMESAERTLAAEERGLRIADQQSGAPRGVRVSRLLILASDGAERFYRHVESLLKRHGPRVLAVRVGVDAETLGALLFGPGGRARLLMLEHKDAVAAVLIALARE